MVGYSYYYQCSRATRLEVGGSERGGGDEMPGVREKGREVYLVNHVGPSEDKRSVCVISTHKSLVDEGGEAHGDRYRRFPYSAFVLRGTGIQGDNKCRL